jgi:death on curing protein
MIKYLTKEDITFINKKTVSRHGGNFMLPENFLHEENLDYLIETVQSTMFEVELYPTIYDKTALYCFNIICNHIFSDGNKRTGLGAAMYFMNLNNFRFKNSLKLDDLFDFITEVAKGNIDLTQCSKWFEENIENRINF